MFAKKEKKSNLSRLFSSVFLFFFPPFILIVFLFPPIHIEGAQEETTPKINAVQKPQFLPSLKVSNFDSGTFVQEEGRNYVRHSNEQGKIEPFGSPESGPFANLFRSPPNAESHHHSHHHSHEAYLRGGMMSDDERRSDREEANGRWEGEESGEDGEGEETEGGQITGDTVEDVSRSNVGESEDERNAEEEGDNEEIRTEDEANSDQEQIEGGDMGGDESGYEGVDEETGQEVDNGEEEEEGMLPTPVGSREEDEHFEGGKEEGRGEEEEQDETVDELGGREEEEDGEADAHRRDHFRTRSVLREDKRKKKNVFREARKKRQQGGRQNFFPNKEDERDYGRAQQQRQKKRVSSKVLVKNKNRSKRSIGVAALGEKVKGKHKFLIQKKMLLGRRFSMKTRARDSVKRSGTCVK